MLLNVNNTKQVKSLSHQKQYNVWRQRISDCEFGRIIDELNLRLDGREIDTSSWMPGNNWEGTVFEPIEVACNHDKEASGLFFGLIVFRLFMDRDDLWGFGRYEKNGIPIKGMTYFRLNNINFCNI